MKELCSVEQNSTEENFNIIGKREENFNIRGKREENFNIKEKEKKTSRESLKIKNRKLKIGWDDWRWEDSKDDIRWVKEIIS